MVAPSLVKVGLPCLFMGCRILSCDASVIRAAAQTNNRTMPLGPRVVFTRSATAIAPTKDDYENRPETYEWERLRRWDRLTKRAFSPFSAAAPFSSLRILGPTRCITEIEPQETNVSPMQGLVASNASMPQSTQHGDTPESPSQRIFEKHANSKFWPAFRASGCCDCAGAMNRKLLVQMAAVSFVVGGAIEVKSRKTC